ncbi:uncharacterized protein LOC132701493 [Cylas formicarius]|uniref:uncharacterized protein LOC132701493 n=1 Tax=Cylas formicarius TaxID=197179 RepID=UPI002958719E|nr:uncharacterized protein LOC132701493 [Cylas formicarius]
MRQARLMMDGPALPRTRELLRLTRRECRALTGAYTGHCRLRRHLCLLGIGDDPECRWCMEGEETPYHLLTECPALTWARLGVFGTALIDPDSVHGLTVYNQAKTYAAIFNEVVDCSKNNYRL